MMSFRAAFASGLLGVVLVGCSSVGPKPQVIYHRPDVKSTTNKVIAMPVTDFSGKRSTAAKAIEPQVLAGWAKMYGKSRVVPSGPVVDQLSGDYADQYLKLLQTVDDVSAIEQMHQNPKFRDLIAKITGTVGAANLAFAIVNGGSTEYDNGQPVNLHLGFFDVRNMTWKWITKVEDTKSMFFGKFEVSAMQMVSNSFSTARAVNRDAKNSGRAPASK